MQSKEKFLMKITEIRDKLIVIFQEVDFIIAAQAYGSWSYGENTVDIDVAVLIPDHECIVDSTVYRNLRDLRRKAGEELKADLDLIPHTMDEVNNPISPLWYPRYNPSLVFGETLKGKFPIQQSSAKESSFGYSDLTAYVLHDNRTICRRQLLRSLEGESGRIFVSKLLHGPGNALTYHACRYRRSYLCSPSDLLKCFDIFDELYGVDSSPAKEFLFGCKENMDHEKALKLMSWYESLVGMVLLEKKKTLYQHVCLELQLT